MQGNPAGIDGRYPGGRSNNQSFGGVFTQVAQKGSFAGSRLTGEKDIAVGMLDKIMGQPQFVICLICIKQIYVLTIRNQSAF